MSIVIQELRNLFADTGKPAEVNADGEFDTKIFNRFVAQQGIAVRYKQGRQDLATIDAAMNNYKKMLKKMMQDQNTNEWAKLITKATRAHNRLAHEALMGNADPNEAYDVDQKNLQFELREEAGNKMAQQNAVISTNQKNVQGQGGIRTYIGREDVRRRGDRPQYSGQVQLVSAVEGNRVKDRDGQIHSMTLSKPVPADSKSTTINVRLSGSAQTEERKREELKPYAESLKTLLVANGAMFTGVASSELYKLEPQFKKALGNMKFGQFVALFSDVFKMQTTSAGGTSKVMLKR